MKLYVLEFILSLKMLKGLDHELNAHKNANN